MKDLKLIEQYIKNNMIKIEPMGYYTKDSNSNVTSLILTGFSWVSK